MRTAGIICEYNPLHAGHAYHIRRTRERTEADVIVCLMSGEFMQRGEPAVCSKWDRARMALLAGADVVIELPFAFAVRSAQYFATGAIRILDALGVDIVSFGSENCETSALQSAAEILADEPPAFRAALREALDTGTSYAAARRTALTAVNRSLGVLLDNPNTVLGIEYMRAILSLGSSMQTLAVPRVGTGHDEPWAAGSAPSAAAVRRALRSSPCSAEAILARAGVPLSFRPANWKEPLFTLLSSKLRTAAPEELGLLADMERGLAWRMIRAGCAAQSYDDLVQQMATRRYPAARIRRLLLYSLFSFTAERAAQADSANASVYGHVLGIREDAKPGFGELCRKASIPVVPSPNRLPASSLRQLDCAASDIYGLLLDPVRAAGADFTAPLIRV